MENDGDIDDLVTNNNGPVRLLRNDTGQDKHWLRLLLVGRESPRDAQDVRVAVFGEQGSMYWKRVYNDGIYGPPVTSRAIRAG